MRWIFYLLTVSTCLNESQGQNEVNLWFRQHVHSVLEHRGLSIELELVKVDNQLQKPGPVFNEIARKAYDLGADFMYRVNDDTEFHGRWPKLYSDTLMSLSKPYGVIGPRCTPTQNRILTHDFVHRTHMEIFNRTYYPVELVDWWMDDWISSVYGISRTFMSKTVTVIHHVKYHGRRYDVNESNQELLVPLTSRAKEQIVSWMKQHENDVLDKDVANFKGESSKYNVDKLRYVTDSGKFEKYYQIKEKKLDTKKTSASSRAKRYTPPKKAGLTSSATTPTAAQAQPSVGSGSAGTHASHSKTGLEQIKSIVITPSAYSSSTHSSLTSVKKATTTSSSVGTASSTASSAAAAAGIRTKKSSTLSTKGSLIKKLFGLQAKPPTKPPTKPFSPASIKPKAASSAAGKGGTTASRKIKNSIVKHKPKSSTTQ